MPCPFWGGGHELGELTTPAGANESLRPIVEGHLKAPYLVDTPVDCPVLKATPNATDCPSVTVGPLDRLGLEP